jgi:uncharacterized protein (TIGR00369 family)
MLPKVEKVAMPSDDSSRVEEALRQHSECFVCGDPQQNPFGLAVKFTPVCDGIVTARFHVKASHQGYHGLLHGGIASTLLDAAMTHCLLQKGIVGLTAELTVRYHNTINVGDEVFIRGEVVQQRHGIFQLASSLTVNDKIQVSAKGKFLKPRT